MSPEGEPTSFDKALWIAKAIAMCDESAAPDGPKFLHQKSLEILNKRIELWGSDPEVQALIPRALAEVAEINLEKELHEQTHLGQLMKAVASLLVNHLEAETDSKLIELTRSVHEKSWEEKLSGFEQGVNSGDVDQILLHLNEIFHDIRSAELE